MLRDVIARGLLTLVMGGCSAEVKGDLTLDSTAFTVSNCRSGQALGFAGIELHHADGRRLRLLARADGTVEVALMPPGKDQGEMLGSCGTLVTRAQRSRINGITNLQGKATLHCKSDSHELTGTIEFENCH